MMKSPSAVYLRHQYRSQAKTANDLESTCLAYQVLLDDLDAFKGLIQRNQAVRAREKIGHGLQALTLLNQYVDTLPTGKVQEQLHEFYDYCSLTLCQYHLDHDMKHIDQVKTMLRSMKETWDFLNLHDEEPIPGG